MLNGTGTCITTWQIWTWTKLKATEEFQWQEFTINEYTLLLQVICKRRLYERENGRELVFYFSAVRFLLCDLKVKICNFNILNIQVVNKLYTKAWGYHITHTHTYYAKIRQFAPKIVTYYIIIRKYRSTR